MYRFPSDIVSMFSVCVCVCVCEPHPVLGAVPYGGDLLASHYFTLLQLKAWNNNNSTENLWWCTIVVVIVCLSSTKPLLLLHDGKPLLRNPSFTFTIRVLPFLSCNVLRLGCWQEPMNSSLCHSLLMAIFYQAVQPSSSAQDRHWRFSGGSWC